MRADRLKEHASLMFFILVLAILTFLSNPAASVYAALDTPEHTPPIESSSPAVFLQTGPKIEVAMTASFQSINAGDPVSFTMTVINLGPGTAQSVTLTDTLPTARGLDWTILSGTDVKACSIANGILTCNIGSLPQAGWFLVKVGSPTTYQSCQTLTNQASASAVNASAVATASAATVVLCPSLTVTKTAGAAVVMAGSPVSFTITVVNNGPGTAYTVFLQDPLPGADALNWVVTTPNSPCSIVQGVLSCPKIDLPPDGRIDVEISATTGLTTCGSYPNVVTVTAANHIEVQKGATVDVLCGTLLLHKTTDTPQVSAGEVIRFSLQVTNADSGTAQSVTLTDPLPAQPGLAWQIVEPVPQGCAIDSNTLTCTFDTLAGGETRAVTVTSPTTSADCGALTNQAHVADSTGRTADASAVVTVLCPHLTFSKTADQAEVQPGSVLGFTLLAGNSGPGTAFAVHLDDPLPSGILLSVDNSACAIADNRLTCDWASLPTVTESIHLTGSAPTATCGSISNTATLAAANHLSLEASASINVPCPQLPDLTVTKTPDRSPLRPGDTAGFTVVVTNIGSGTAANVALVDTLPSGAAWSVDNTTGCKLDGLSLTCGLGDLPAGQSITLKISGVLGSACTQLVNQVTVSASNEPQALTRNNTAEASIDVQCLADLVVTKTVKPTFDQVYQWRISKKASPTKVWQQVGSLAHINFSIMVNQTGIVSEDFDLNGQISITNPNPATAVSGVNAADQVNNGGTCTVTGGTDITIPAGTTVTLNYHCDYPDNGVSDMSGVNTATVTWDPSIGTPNHSATAAADFTFGSGSENNPAVVNQTVTLRDTFLGITLTLGKVTGVSSAPFASKTLTHTIPIPVVPGCITYTNKAFLSETGQQSSVRVTICGSLKTGARTTAFWRGDQGQKIVRTLDENPTCGLTSWLRQFAPFQDLNSKSPCPAVASYVKTVIDRAERSRAAARDQLKAQALATALNIYFSDPALGGNALDAKSPIGGYTVDLTRICSDNPEDGACQTVDASDAFNHEDSLTILKALAASASESHPGGSDWYDNSTSRITLAMKTFRAINNEWAFGVSQ